MAKKKGMSVSELIRDLLDMQLREQKYTAMRHAAHELKADYEANDELTEMTALDGEHFINV